jgi:hypothetical protein
VSGLKKEFLEKSKILEPAVNREGAYLPKGSWKASVTMWSFSIPIVSSLHLLFLGNQAEMAVLRILETDALLISKAIP